MPSHEYYQKRRIRFYSAFEKFGGCCKNCGSKESLQFDHIDESTKLYNISEMHYHSDKLFYDELDKCQLLCKTCHERKTGSYLQEVYRKENNPNSKLTEKDVEYIRLNYIPRHKEFGARALSRRFSVRHPTILSILSENTWK